MARWAHGHGSDGTPMNLALMHAAGLRDELVHVDYANHFIHMGHDGAASKPEMLADKPNVIFILADDLG